MSRVLRIATRKSALAMWQARHVQSLITQSLSGTKVELIPIVTEGDRIQDRPLSTVGGKGLFLKELEYALLNDEADLAVHSMKDVPAGVTEGLALDVVLRRANPFDAFVSNSASSFETLPAGGRVGTSSLRRQCQMAALRPDLQFLDLRGNVDTRLRKLDDGEYDAVILACAGLERLGWGDRITQQLKPPHFLPASTQGIICLQFRSNDLSVWKEISHLNDDNTSIQARAERTVAYELEGSCQLPLAVYARIPASNCDELQLEAMVGLPDGSSIVRSSQIGNSSTPELLGKKVAQELLNAGAREIIDSLK
ncbi:MAG: hydroxymethylbilane synthase [Lysobacterales bacterium]|jgi:hydroxymethylbilane synthase